MTARRRIDHRAASPRRSHQVSRTAAATWAAVACGVRVWTCEWVMRMPCMTITGCGRAAPKARCSPPWEARVAPPMAARGLSRPPSSHPAANTGTNPAVCVHTGGAVPVARVCPPAASSTQSAANTAARRLRTAGDALMAIDTPTCGPGPGLGFGFGFGFGFGQ
ncbi:conserved hypothetical protein [Streptomyces sviceus ATCC 29083]|uniref:Uncharacterized protein n=1 Tax=Streptomyces sviceus (strain ATCC 29083 / DSM 924 / JCM 4929 / NBRC 13980 / NCIMB 11184 / NRRL 5439 / UC 5370) TaxID=463191 RepID=B5HT51_STRX2|nr:conserved hypothetical protein [Streptomyces sviceus ATCC 29083]